jgi:hypothetical protein
LVGPGGGLFSFHMQPREVMNCASCARLMKTALPIL